MSDLAWFLFWLWTDLAEAGHELAAEMVRRVAARAMAVEK